jgi:hypothetical protein
MREENTQVFTPQDVEKGLLKDFLDILCKMQTECENSIEIRIWTDGYCEEVSWFTTFKEDPRSYQSVDSSQFVDEWIDGTTEDGHTISYRASDLEDPEFCDQNNIVYDATARKWSLKPQKSEKEVLDKEK